MLKIHLWYYHADVRVAKYTGYTRVHFATRFLQLIAIDEIRERIAALANRRQILRDLRGGDI